MTEDQLSHLYAFARGDTSGQDFEQWFYEQPDLESHLGETRYLTFLSADYRDREQVRLMRNDLSDYLAQFRRCECPAIRNGSAIPMGADFYFEKVFDTLRKVAEYGPDKWWLYVSKCSQCHTNWLVAQDERIYDEFFLERLTEEQAHEAIAGSWPNQFQSYEAVLRRGREVSNPPIYVDPLALGLVLTAEDLLRERPNIEASEIASLLGISDDHARQLLHRARTKLE